MSTVEFHFPESAKGSDSEDDFLRQKNKSKHASDSDSDSDVGSKKSKKTFADTRLFIPQMSQCLARQMCVYQESGSAHLREVHFCHFKVAKFY